MQAYGYQKDSEILENLEEVTLDCTLEEIDRLIDFLKIVRKEHGDGKENSIICHSHFRDWDVNWASDSSDFIISTTFRKE